MNVSVGYFLSDTFEVSVRQSANYSNGAGSADYDGATFVAVESFVKVRQGLAIDGPIKL